jgi:hypothetical protein
VCRSVASEQMGRVLRQRALRGASLLAHAEGGRGTGRMDVLYERVAGIDIGKKTLTCCVRTPGRDGSAAQRDAPLPNDDPVVA